MAHVGWIGSFYALALLNLLLGGGLIWRFLPAPQVTSQRAKPGFRQTFALAWRTPLLGWILLVEIATLSYLWGVAPVARLAARRAPLLATGYRPAGGCPLSVKPRLKVSWRRAPRQNAPGAGAAAVYYRRPTHRRFCAGADAQPAAGDAGAVYAGGERFLGLQGAAIPAVVQHHAPREAVGSAYGIINGIGNICAAFIPLLMGVVMKSVGSVSSGFSVLVASQLITLCAGGALLLRMRRAAAVNASIP